MHRTLLHAGLLAGALATGAVHAAPDATAAYTAQLQSLEGAEWIDQVLGADEVAVVFLVKDGRLRMRFSDKEPGIALEPLVARPNARYLIETATERLCRGPCSASLAMMDGGAALILNLDRPGKPRESRMFRRVL